MFDKYLQYEIEDWITDDDFIQYVNGKDSFMTSVVKHFKDEPEVFRKINESARFIKRFNHNQIEVGEDRLEKLFSKINKTIDRQTPSKNTAKVFSIRRLAWAGGIAAAIVLILLVLPVINSQNLQQFATEIGEQQSITLPDQSIVEINTLSSISFNSKKWEKERTVSLEGEAFFKVEKGKTFSVKSNNGTVRVLGTQFNIYDRNNKFEVECLEGRVSVLLKSGEEYILNGGDRLSQMKNSDINVERTSVETIDWMNDFVELKNAPLMDVLEEMGRYYQFEIQNNQNLENYPYSGFFSTKSLDSAIYQVLWPLNIEYELQGNKLIIK